jgi:hypothetical protein
MRQTFYVTGAPNGGCMTTARGQISASGGAECNSFLGELKGADPAPIEFDHHRGRREMTGRPEELET